MDMLNQLLTENIRDFGATFAAATRERADAAPSGSDPVWLEGWGSPASVGYVLGDGEFIHNGEPRRFYFSGVPTRPGASERLSGAGTVSGLRALRDFSGVYLPWRSAATGVRPAAEVYLRNRQGVVIALSASEGGLVELPYGGLRLRLAADL